MGFYQTHSGWTYIQHNLLMTTDRKYIAEYYNDTGSPKRILSVTFEKMGVANGYVPSDGGGDSLNCTGEATDVYLIINGKTSNTQNVDNKCDPYYTSDRSMSWYNTNSCQSYTFTFSDGPEIGAGDTASIEIHVESPNATNRGIVINRSRSDSSLYIHGSVQDPYKQPTISISTGTYISNYDSQRSIYVSSNDSGDSSSTTTYVTVNGNEERTSIGNGGGDYYFTPNNKGVGQASSYTVRAKRVHDRNSSLSKTSNELTLYTYKLPDITSFSVDPTTISGNAKGNPQIKWSTNNRRWSNMENQFKTYYSTNSGSSWKELGNNNPTNDNAGNTAQTKTITQAFIESILSVAQRSNASSSFKLRLMRKNESSGKTKSTSDVTVTVNYKPTKTIGENNILYYDCNSDNKTPDTTKQLFSGREYFIDEHPYVYVKWTYPSDIDGGVIDGYIFKVYTDSTCTTTKFTKTINTTDLTTGQALNIRTELNRGTINWVGIQPFYNKADGTGKLYGTENKKQFIKPIGKLKKPIIDGPINGTSWHNNQFRILVTAPADDDMDCIPTDFNIDNDTYRYKAIELDINGIVYTFNNNANIFSTATVSYMKPLVINPSLVGSTFPNVTSYTIKIRFQKNYYSNIWSEWSDIVTISNYAINEITQTEGIKKEEKILIDHYLTVRNYSVRLYDVYFINRNNLPNTNIVLQKGSIIKAENYQGIYDSILQIQNKVNDYATFDNDRTNVKFNKNIDNFAGNNKPTRGEIITQDKISNNPIGRNYMNICIECMNKLSN